MEKNKLINLTYLLVVLFVFGCKKNSTQISTYAPMLTTTSVSSITQTNAQSGGNILNDGGSTIILSGICWSTNQNPTIDFSTKTTNNTNSTGVFTSILTGLTLNTTYYLRAYAKNSIGTGYGNQITFTTPTYTIGQSYGGGAIFYIDNTRIHGLIAASLDQNKSSDQTIWSNGNTNLLTNATSSTDGNANTTLIITSQGNTGSYAAKLCKDFRGGSFTDWFLPSVGQLQTLFAAESDLQTKAAASGKVDPFFASFSGGLYWSSTEASKDGALVVSFQSGQSQVVSKSGNNSSALVRSIRTF